MFQIAHSHQNAAVLPRLANWALTVGLIICSSGCRSDRLPTPEEQLAKAIQAATSNNAMWYRFTLEAEYQGNPFKIDQMVTCTRSVISGGSLGQSPDSVISEAHPMTAAAQMLDGSQVLVRIPNMCSRYRKYERLREFDDPKYRGNPNDIGTWGYRPGWKSRGPYAVLPLVIWSDKLPKPSRIESYVAREYYAQPTARIQNPKGLLDLWPVGKYPRNYLAVLKQETALPRYPNPLINPALNPNGRGGGRDGRYHGKGETYGAFTIVPVDNFNTWVQRYGDLAREYRRRSEKDEALPDTRGIILTDSWTEPKLLEADATFVHPRFAAYHDRNPQFPSLEAEKSFVTSNCVAQAVGGLMLGKPGMSDFPYDAADWGSDVPDRVRVGIYEGARSVMRTKYAGKQARQRNCNAQLSKLRAFDIIDGRLDASKALPGMIVYRKWYGESDGWKGQAFSNSFIASGAIEPNGNIHRLRINGVDLQYPLEGARRDDWYPVIFEDKKSGEWFQVITYGDGFFGGEGENNGF